VDQPNRRGLSTVTVLGVTDDNEWGKVMFTTVHQYFDSSARMMHLAHNLYLKAQDPLLRDLAGSNWGSRRIALYINPDRARPANQLTTLHDTCNILLTHDGVC